MPPFVGHALDSYHWQLVARLKQSGTTDGFLTRKTLLGPDAKRPVATTDNKGVLWINSEPTVSSADDKAFISNGTRWVPQRRAAIQTSLDLSVRLAREVVLEAMKRAATGWFDKYPNDIFVFGTEPEDGSYATLQRDLKNPNWYPDYLAAEGVPFGRPYALHGFRGVDQPIEIWDSAAASDHVFGFNNWLLREYDKWIDSLPEDKRVTTTGKDKKVQVRTSSYSYNYHDVPPNFNLDPRIRVMVAGYPKHRGTGKWIQFSSYRDIAAAFQKLLPREPSGEYRIVSLADFGDRATKGIPAKWSASPSELVEDLGKTYEVGTKALTIETDFNYGKYGLGYYLMSKLLWNARLTVDELDTIRDRWLQRAFGDGWTDMKAYCDYMLPENYPCNTPAVWARAIRLLDKAASKVDGEKAPDVQRRFDELKQFWYFYCLLDSGQAIATNNAFREFIWKCQTSYITSTDMLIDRFPDANRSPVVAAGGYAKGPAHYTHEETNKWWAKVLNYWPATVIDDFVDNQLVDGTAGHTVDMNDLVRVQEFQNSGPGSVCTIDRHPAMFYTVAQRPGESIGFRLFWPHRVGNRSYEQRMVTYELDRWDAKERRWNSVIDSLEGRVLSQSISRSNKSVWQTATVTLPATTTAVYRFSVHGAGSDARIAGVTYDVESNKYIGASPFTFASAKTACYDYFGKYWFYIPRGTKSLVFEMADKHPKVLRLHTRDSAKAMAESRRIQISDPGTHRIKISAAESGNLASFERAPSAPSASAFHVPYLYTVPMLWARSPVELVLPRAIAKADGWSIVETRQAKP